MTMKRKHFKNVTSSCGLKRQCIFTIRRDKIKETIMAIITFSKFYCIVPILYNCHRI